MAWNEIGEGFSFSMWIVRFPLQCNLIATFSQISIQCVFGDIDLPICEPTGRGILHFARMNFLKRPLPLKVVGNFGPELLGVLLAFFLR